MILHSQKEVINFRHGGAGVFMPSTSPKPSTTNFFTSAVNPTIALVLPEEKVIKDSFYVIYYCLLENIKLARNL
jgi:hypothetical protein